MWKYKLQSMLVFGISEFLQNVTNKSYSKYINKKQYKYITLSMHFLFHLTKFYYHPSTFYFLLSTIRYLFVVFPVLEGNFPITFDCLLYFQEQNFLGEGLHDDGASCFLIRIWDI